MLQPDFEAIYNHINFLFGGQPDGKIEIAYTPASSGAVNQCKFFGVKDAVDAAKFAYEANKKEGVNVYIGAALRKNDTPPFSRSDIHDFYKATAIWCDLDDADAARKAKDKYKNCAPSLVIVTGRHPDLRAQCWWRLDEPNTDPVRHKAILANVCAALDGDKSVVDSARVMRLGGTIAWPKKAGRVPELTEIKPPENATKHVSLSDFTSHFPAASPVDNRPAVGEVGLFKPTPIFNTKEDFSISQVCDMLNHIHPDGDYLDWLNVGMALKDYGVSFDVWDAWSAQGGKYPSRAELQKKWNSFKGQGVTIGSLYFHAHRGGYHPSKYRAVITGAAQATEKYNPDTGEIIEDTKTASAPIRRTLPLLYADEITPVTNSSDFVEDLLRDNEFSVIYGASNCGKTFFMLDLAMHVALGMEWRGKEVAQGGVIYAALEGGHGTKNRIVAFKSHYGIQGKIPLAVIPSNINFLDGENDMPALLDAIAGAKERLGNVRLIVIDTLARAIGGGDENSSMDMGQLIINADKIRELTNAHIAFVHHSGKDELRGARGHSSLRAAVDTEIEISRPDTESPSTIKVVKQREMEMIDDMAFRLERITLGVNQRGKEVASCVVMPTDVQEGSRPPKMIASENFILEAIQKGIENYGIRKQPYGKDSPWLDCLTFIDLGRVLDEMGLDKFIDDEGEPISAMKATKTQRVRLRDKGLIGFNGGLIWLIKSHKE